MQRSILLFTILIGSKAGTMFELARALDDGVAALKKQASNSIGLNAGCELFIAFVTLFPHASDVCSHSFHFFIDPSLNSPRLNSDLQNFIDLKAELIREGQIYATEAGTYRRKIAELAVGFIKDGSVVHYISPGLHFSRLIKYIPIDFDPLIFQSCNADSPSCTQTEKDLRCSSLFCCLAEILTIVTFFLLDEVFVTEARPRGLGYVFYFKTSSCKFT